MATIERRNDTFRVIFYHAGRRYTATLKTTDAKAAAAVSGSVERTLGLLRQGAISPPAGADFVQFVLSGGYQTDLPKGAEVRTFKDLRDRYLATLGVGAVEANTLLTIRIHLDHWTRTLGAGFPVQSLARDDLQRHVTRQAGQKGRRGRTAGRPP